MSLHGLTEVLIVEPATKVEVRKCCPSFMLVAEMWTRSGVLKASLRVLGDSAGKKFFLQCVRQAEEQGLVAVVGIGKAKSRVDRVEEVH